MAIREITFTVGSDLSVTPNSPQQAGVQGDHKATEVRFAIPPAVSGQCDKWYMELITGCGSYDKTETLTVQYGQVSFLLPREWTQDEGVANIRLVGISTTIDDDTGEEVAAAVAHTFEGKLVFATRQDAVSKVKPLVDKEIALLMERAKAAVECAERVAEISGGGVIYLSKDEANYETIKAELDSGKEVIIVDNDGNWYRCIYDDGESISFASQGDSYYKVIDYFINFVSEYEGNLVREEDVQHVYDANSDKPISGKAVAKALATTSGGGGAAAKGLAHLKSITLDEAVSRVEIEFDNPVNEFYLYISGTCKGYEDMPATFSFGVCETATETETPIKSTFNNPMSLGLNGDFEVEYLQHIRVLSDVGYCTTTTEALQYKSIYGGVKEMLIDMREPGFEMIPKPNANQIKKIVCSVVDIEGGANVQFGAGQKFDVWGVEV